MRSLNTSLPSTSSPRRQPSQPPEQLIQIFKQAALSVTNLYKTAASEHEKAYQEGYQDALEELLSFLDKKNLGLQDGEGWRVRQWATERFQGTVAATAPSASESDEEVEEEKRARSSSPVVQRKPSRDLLQSQPQPTPANPAISHVRSESAPPITSVVPEPPSPESVPTYTIPQSEFTFQTSHQYPSVHDIDMDNSDGNVSNNGQTLHVNIVPRPSRNSTRHNSQNARSNARTINPMQLGAGAGMKRRFPTFDFFDLGGFNGKDGPGGGGGKRGRFS